MTADAVVVAADANGRVDLEFAPSRQCGACAGTCLWKRLQASRLELNLAGAALAPGMAVTVALPERSVLHASALVHGVPLVAILAGAASGAFVSGSDSGTLAGALVGLAVAVACFRRFSLRLEQATLRNLIVTPRA